MNYVDPEMLDRFCKLKEQYLEKYKNSNIPEHILIPIEFVNIEDYKTLGDILAEALEKNILLSETDYIQQMHEFNVYRRLESNIDESVSRRM